MDYLQCLDRKNYTIEVKSGRWKSTKGLSGFIKRYLESIHVIINHDNVEKLLRAPDIALLFVMEKSHNSNAA